MNYISVTNGGACFGLASSISSGNKTFDVKSLGESDDLGGAIDLGVFRISGSSESGDDWRSWKYWIKGSVNDLLILSNFSLTGEVLTLVTTLLLSFSSELNGWTSATGLPVGVSMMAFEVIFSDSLLVDEFGGDELLLDKDNLERGKIWVEIPSFGDSLVVRGGSGFDIISRSSGLMIVISPGNREEWTIVLFGL